MSAKVLVLANQRAYKLKRSLADRKVRAGGFRYRDPFTIEQIQASPVRPFDFGPSASAPDWSPRRSAGFLVMQLRTGFHP